MLIATNMDNTTKLCALLLKSKAETTFPPQQE
jgi:hypothetical protein